MFVEGKGRRSLGCVRVVRGFVGFEGSILGRGVVGFGGVVIEFLLML